MWTMAAEVQRHAFSVTKYHLIREARLFNNQHSGPLMVRGRC